MPSKKYIVDFENVGATKNITMVNCNSVQFVNLGTSTVSINKSANLITGQTLNIEGNFDEVCATVFTVSFDNTGTNNCLVIKKSYV